MIYQFMYSFIKKQSDCKKYIPIYNKFMKCGNMIFLGEHMIYTSVLSLTNYKKCVQQYTNNINYKKSVITHDNNIRISER